MIQELRSLFNQQFTAEKYAALLHQVDQKCATHVEFRVAETPIFLPLPLIMEMAEAGAALTCALLESAAYLEAARQAIPAGYAVAGETARPTFLTADFALVREPDGTLSPRLVEIQAFPSVYGYQDVLGAAYQAIFNLAPGLGRYLSGLDEASYWELLRKTVVGQRAPENVALLELDPQHQKTLPDFNVTAQKLGIAVVDIRSVEPVGRLLHYRDAQGRLTPIHRIYNRAIADELIARQVTLPFDLTSPWDVEWAGHPNWYFLISKFSIPWLSGPLLTLPETTRRVVPPAVFLDEFLEGNGRNQLKAAGVALPEEDGSGTSYSELLLKPLFSFAGKGIQFEPAQADLEAIPVERRRDFLLQKRMRFEPTIATPEGLTQAEIRILYLWPDDGELTPVMPLIRLGRGKMMGVDHNRDQRWVGASAAFFPTP